MWSPPDFLFLTITCHSSCGLWHLTGLWANCKPHWCLLWCMFATCIAGVGYHIQNSSLCSNICTSRVELWWFTGDDVEVFVPRAAVSSSMVTSSSVSHDVLMIVSIMSYLLSSFLPLSSISFPVIEFDTRPTNQPTDQCWRKLSSHCKCTHLGISPAWMTTWMQLNSFWLPDLLWTGRDLCGDHECLGWRRCRTSSTPTGCHGLKQLTWPELTSLEAVDD